jgi:rfaE bifunctional protein nucleotidyltransferase chain/domain
MSSKKLSPTEAVKKSKELKKDGKTIVLAGGCFDILHAGHIAFLKNAKIKGDRLFVLLESDESIRRMKGSSRPVHTQSDRASILSSIDDIDCIILLPDLKTDEDYDKLIFAIKPDIIATTEGDKGKAHKLRQASLIGAEVIDVIKRIENVSTTRLRKKVDKNK